MTRNENLTTEELLDLSTPQNGMKRNVFNVLEHITDSQKDDGVAKNILLRVDYNVPMIIEPDGNHKIADDSRIRASLPTIQAILKAKCNAILISHMGRPKLVQKKLDKDGTERSKLSLRPASERLSKLLEMDVGFATDCIGTDVERAVASLPREGGGLLLLENLRFYAQEEKNEENFAKSLASLCDAYINDAFGTCHRAHASVTGIPSLLPKELCGVGCLVSSEISYLDFSSLEKGSSVIAIIGGSKVSTKLPVIKGLLNQVDTLVLGGGLAFTFIKGLGVPVGNSLVEDSMIETSQDLMTYAKQHNKKIVLPLDAVCGTSFPSKPVPIEETKTFDLVEGSDGIDDGWSGFDVGPKSISWFKKHISGAAKVVFNGPMGVFEMPPYDNGTRGIVDILEDVTKNGTVSVVGGGDSVAALEAFGKTDVVSYVSTGGGATLELLAGDKLPGVEAISNIE